MKDHSIKKSLKLLVTIALISYPICFVIQWTTPQYQALSSYYEMLRYLWHFILEYGDWILIVFLTYKLTASQKIYYQVAEQMRVKHFIAEYFRWDNTPYVPPILLYYLIKPPVALSPIISDIAQNRFYQTIVDTFRSRVYIHADYSEVSPERKQPLIKVIGVSSLFPPFIGFLLIAVFFYFLYQQKPADQWFTGYERFALPFLVAVSWWNCQYISALLKYGQGKHIELDMMNLFSGCLPKTPWRDVFPDCPQGETILHVWYSEREYRQRYWNYMHQIPITDQMIYNSPFLPPFPYPAKEIPAWTDQSNEFYSQKISAIEQKQLQHNRQAAKQSKGKVVVFNKRKV
ncbi:hypothetical protein [Brevibacillus sp. 179-C9.3 HS]|uniref:hypothetical protein n=1 Tax=unclassified Brevibacillus TaxID=2684853 RepID=UPI00399F7FE8